MAVNCRNFSASRLKKTWSSTTSCARSLVDGGVTQRAFLVRMFISRKAPHGQGLDPDRVHISAAGCKELNQCNSAAEPQHFLNFFPLPHGQGSLRPTLPPSWRATARSCMAWRMGSQ